MLVFLQEAKKVCIDQDLKAILSDTPGRCVPYAVIEGESGYLESINEAVVLRLVKSH